MKIKKVLFLILAQVIVPFFPAPVLSFSGYTADHIDHCFGSLEVLIGYKAPFRHCKWIFCISVKRILCLFGVFQDFFFPGKSGIFIAVMIIPDPVCTGDSHPGLFQGSENRNIFPVVHISGAGSPFYRLFSSSSKKSYRQRKG